MTSERTKKAQDKMQEVLTDPARSGEQGQALKDWVRSIEADVIAEHEVNHPDYVGDCKWCTERAKKKIEARAERDRQKRNA